MTVKKLAYERELFDFETLLDDALTIDGLRYLDPTICCDSTHVELLRLRLPEVRNRIFETMLGSAFQSLYCEFSKFLAACHFNEAAYFQKIPSIRLHLPGALGTSWHTDNWYGHGPRTNTFWVPVTPVRSGAGVSFINDQNFLIGLENRLQTNELKLHEINDLCSAQGSEWTCQCGEYLVFNSTTLHGSVGNSSNSFRCSFDFRGSPVSEGVGNKSLSNYRVIENSTSYSAVAEFEGGKALKYINGSIGPNTKYQHILIETYAADNGMRITRNEAEIESIRNRPVLRAYTTRKIDDPDSYDHIIIYSLQALPTDLTNLTEVIHESKKSNVLLHFVLEEFVLSGDTDPILLLNIIKKSSTSVTRPAEMNY